MSLNLKEIQEIANIIKSHTDWIDRPFLNRTDLLETVSQIHDTEAKLVILQLVDYIIITMNLSKIEEVTKHDDQLIQLVAMLKLLEKSMVEAKDATQRLRNDYDKENKLRRLYEIKAKEEENTRKLYQKRIARALKLWTKTDANFEDSISSKMAEQLQSDIDVT